MVLVVLVGFAFAIGGKFSAQESESERERERERKRERERERAARGVGVWERSPRLVPPPPSTSQTTRVFWCNRTLVSLSLLLLGASGQRFQVRG